MPPSPRQVACVGPPLAAILWPAVTIAIRSGHEGKRRNRLHSAGSPAVFRTSGCTADANGCDGETPEPDAGQHREGFAGSADANLVHVRSEDRRALSGHVRDHGGPLPCAPPVSARMMSSYPSA